RLANHTAAFQYTPWLRVARVRGTPMRSAIIAYEVIAVPPIGMPCHEGGGLNRRISSGPYGATAVAAAKSREIINRALAYKGLSEREDSAAIDCKSSLVTSPTSNARLIFSKI
ncbi:hypothetical protein C0992_001353, partial [Termitomyces sp. T32_za158]